MILVNLSIEQANAVEPIIRPYLSARSAGMGGVRLTTGLYDENFFGNPARVTANPVWKVQFADIMLETTTSTLSTVTDLISGGLDDLSALDGFSGQNLHSRVQLLVLPTFYIPCENMSWGFGVLATVQSDLNIRQNFTVSPQSIVDAGPALTVGRKFKFVGSPPSKHKIKKKIKKKKKEEEKTEEVKKESVEDIEKTEITKTEDEGEETEDEVEEEIAEEVNEEVKNEKDDKPKTTEGDLLSVGLTTHATYRMAVPSTFTLTDLIQGEAFDPQDLAGDGAHVDFDIGATYVLQWHPWDLDIQPGFAVNNILGGKYDNLGIHILDSNVLPPVQPRTYGFGVSARKPMLGKLTNTTLALEFTDIGNNPDGSFFRLVHMGAETHFGIISLRLGLNQGYWTAGLGFNFYALEIDAATYGEELSTNIGFWEERRYAVRLSLQI